MPPHSRPTPPDNRLAPGIAYERGVYVAPWAGDGGELVLIAITSRHTLATEPVTIAHGASRLDASDRLWNALDALDPNPPSHLRLS